MKLTLTSTLIASALTLAAFSSAAQAQGRLVVYCERHQRNVRNRNQSLQVKNMM